MGRCQPTEALPEQHRARLVVRRDAFVDDLQRIDARVRQLEQFAIRLDPGAGRLHRRAAETFGQKAAMPHQRLDGAEAVPGSVRTEAFHASELRRAGLELPGPEVDLAGDAGGIVKLEEGLDGRAGKCGEHADGDGTAKRTSVRRHDFSSMDTRVKAGPHRVPAKCRDAAWGRRRGCRIRARASHRPCPGRINVVNTNECRRRVLRRG